MQKILVIIPAYNEEKNIGTVIADVKEAVPDADILVINDGSNDFTGDVARGKGAIVLDMPYNSGLGVTMQTGYKFALQYGYETVVRVDGDGQHNPRDIYALLEPIKEGKCDLVIGSRYTKNEGFQSTRLRRLGSRYFTGLIHLLIREKILDPTSGYRACNHRVIAFFARYYPRDFATVETLIDTARNGFRVEELPVVMQRRVYGKSYLKSFFTCIFYMTEVTIALFISMIKPPKKTKEESLEYDSTEITNSINS